MFRLSTRVLRYAQSLAYVSVLALLSLLPLRLAYRVARGMSRVWCALDVTRRKATTAALAARLQIDRAQAEPITRRSFELMCCDDLESWLIPRLSRASVGRLICFEGLGHLDAALARGRGAVLYSGHIWGSRLCIVGLGLLGYRIAVVRLRLNVGSRDPVRRWLFDRYRRTVETRLGLRILGSGGRDGRMAIGPLCVSALRRNEIVALKSDRLYKKNTRPGDLDVSFLDGEARFRPGGAVVARAAGAPLLSIWVHRPVDLLPSQCVIGPPVEAGGDVSVVVAAQAARIEAEVRHDPACLRAWLSPRITRVKFS